MNTEDRALFDALVEGLAQLPGEDPEVAAKVAGACQVLDTLDLPYEVCGVWVWVEKTEATRQHRAALKEAGFRWGKKKGRWYFPGRKSIGRRSHSMDYIRDKYGSVRVSADD